MHKLTWDLEELCDGVFERLGKFEYMQLKPCLNSIDERQEFARFHYHEAKDLLDEFLKEDITRKEVFQKVLRFGGGFTSDFEEKKIKARAHVVAFLQSLHCLTDTLSHVIYFSLGLNSAKSDSDISMNKVLRWVPENPQNHYFKNLLKELTMHEDYKYLNALVNYSKHRSILSINISFNLRKEGNKMKEVKFPLFKHKGEIYHARDAYTFLEREFNRQSKLIIQIGNELNNLVQVIQKNQGAEG